MRMYAYAYASVHMGVGATPRVPRPCARAHWHFSTRPHPPLAPGIKLDRLTWGALVDGNTNEVTDPESGGILGMQSADCDAALLSCYPSFLDTVSAQKGLPKVVSYCGHEVRGRTRSKNSRRMHAVKPVRSISARPLVTTQQPHN